MDYKKRLQEWLDHPLIDKETKEELRAIEDEKELEDRFYLFLEFGKAGLRGKLGAGTNRMNPYVIGKTTQGLANTIKKYGKEAMEKGVVIARDVRIMSKEFSEIAASVFAGNGIRTYLFDDIRPTPMLSYAVRDIGTISGIVITASHNPREYNGYKVYWEKGSQILEDKAEEIVKEIDQLSLEDVKTMDFQEGKNQGLILTVPQEVEERYYAKTLDMKIHDDIDKDIMVIYTPLNGTGNLPVRKVLKDRGFENIFVVPEQECPDGTFATVGYPNPEDPKAFEYALKYGKEKNADLILATDPDCDRVAAMSKNGDGYIFINGNQMGALLIDYIIHSREEMGTLPEKGAIVKSVVTGNMGFDIVKDTGIHTFQTLTGFKNICALPNFWDDTDEFQFVFGYEESIGYVYGDYVRDKDAVVTSMMIVEMAGYYKKQGKSLYDVLEELYKKHGYYGEDLTSLVLDGKEGSERILRMMNEIRNKPFKEIGDCKVIEVIDFKDGYQEYYNIGATNLLRYTLEDESWFCIRPSGTEPKIKLYIYVKGKSPEERDDKLSKIKTIVLERLEDVK
ncbi:MAG: phospho-sugar mutase [Tissierellia bacterium]|nr:phospho-sugar mutase [Tissierellia bacterium]